MVKKRSGSVCGDSAQVFTEHLSHAQHLPHSCKPHQVDTMTQVGKLRLSEEQWLVQVHKYHVLWRFLGDHSPSETGPLPPLPPAHSHQSPIVSSTAHCSFEACLSPLLYWVLGGSTWVCVISIFPHPVQTPHTVSSHSISDGWDVESLYCNYHMSSFNYMYTVSYLK